MLIYFIQVVLGIALAWLSYRLFLKGKASGKTNRYFLIGGLILPFILPLLPLSPEVINAAEPILLPEFNLIAGTQAIEQPAGDHSWNWLFMLYLGGVLSLLLYHTSGLIHFFRAIHNAQRIDDDEVVFQLDNINMPFSFFGKVFLPGNLSREDQRLIVAHEAFHIKRKHSWDVMLSAIIHSVLWFFPLMPFYMRDLRQEHEFEVDQLMLEENSFEHYAETLLQFNLKPIHHRLFHSFSSPNLKKRIIMMTKRQKQNTWKLILFIPLIGSLIYLNACNKQEVDSAKSATDSQVENASTNNEADQDASLKMDMVDVPPQFEYCATNESKQAQMQCFNSAMIKVLTENLEYPEEAKKEGFKGKVFVQFTIDKNGELVNPEVIKSDTDDNDGPIGHAFRKAALKVFADFPRAIPGKKDGKNVAVEFVVPINFQLQ